MTSLVWLHDGLLAADHPPLRGAVDRDESVLVLYVLDEESPEIRPLGGAARWWLHHSLAELGDRLAERGGSLVLRRGPAGDVVPAVAADTGADAVFWNRRYGGPEREIDTALKTRLREEGLEVDSFAANLLFEPWTIRTGSNTPYSVFTPFWRACQEQPAPRAPLPEPRTIDGTGAAGDDLADWDLLPTRPDWAGGLREAWEPGERAARQRLRAFLAEDLGDYDRARDEPAAGATSLLSPRLRWGEISPYTVWHETVEAAGTGAHAVSAHRFLSELGWREFAWHTLCHFPDLATRNWRSAFDAFPWPRLKPSHLRAWQRGETGVPLVDAGMRELWATGYMHNRVRMVVASYLTKNLAIHWQRGEEWFWDTLVDADGANNPFNWQWVAGSGADASPYFRIFNPERQAEKFDPRGLYIAQWAPDSADREPLVDLAETRREALDAYEHVKRAR